MAHRGKALQFDYLGSGPHQSRSARDVVRVGGVQVEHIMDGNRHVHHQVHSLTKKPLGVSQVASMDSVNRLDRLDENHLRKNAFRRAREMQPWQTLVRIAQDRRKGAG